MSTFPSTLITSDEQMGTVIVLTGSLGCGKTTVGRLLAQRMNMGVHIETDLFYRFFSHPVPAHLPEADGQNRAAQGRFSIRGAAPARGA